jgi:4,4'-diaponeurosporenoate glycosyltransferase
MPVPSLRVTLRATGWLAGWWLLWRLPPPPKVATQVATRSISVIIPARDEAGSLPHLLRSLATQTSPPGEIIVVDDHSSDGTGALARANGARVLASAALPAGWTGKTWACHQGAAVAEGDILWFLDADVTLAPDALARLAGAHARLGGMVSVQPFHLTEQPYEQLSAVCNIVELMGTAAFSAPPRRPAAMAFGPCVIIGRAAYRQTGGHAHPEVRSLIAEDIGLAGRCRAEGLPVTSFAGRDTVRFRMYPDGPRQLVEGWTKMLAYGARRTPAPVALGVGMWMTAAILAASDGVGGLALRRLRRDQRHRRRALAGYLAWALQMRWMLRRVGTFSWSTAAAWPIPVAAFVGLFGRSVVARVTRRGPRWRGRATPPR